jgi:hypothetical protein
MTDQTPPYSPEALFELDRKKALEILEDHEKTGCIWGVQHARIALAIANAKLIPRPQPTP